MTTWFVLVVALAVVAGVLTWFALRRQKNVPVRKHRIPADIKDWTPKHFVDETAEFTAIQAGRHATDTAHMPAVRPDVPRA